MLICPFCDAEGWKYIEEVAPFLAERYELISSEPKNIVDDDEDSAIQPGMPLLETVNPTTVQVAAHNLTHLP